MKVSTLRPAWPFLLLVLAIAAVYLPGRGGGFAFDDFPNIVDNAALHVTNWDRHAWMAALFSSNAGVGHRPLAMATFALNHLATGLDPVPMKLTNIAIHALNACLVLCLLRTLLALAVPAIDARRREWTARFAAAAWALHPINLMAVLFVVQRMESLCHAFVFAGLWLYLLGRQRQLAGDAGGGWRILIGVVGGTALGALCKESAALLPLYAACIELCLFGFRDARGARDRRLLGFFGIVLVLPAMLGSAWLLSRALAPHAFARRDFTLVERLLTEGRVVLDYVRWSVFPSLRQFGLYHDDIAISRGWWNPPATTFAFVALAAFAAIAFALRKRRPLVALGIAWFFCAQLLTATVVPLELVFEHRNYFASLGICLAVADFLLLSPQRASVRRIGALLAVSWLLFLGMTTCLRALEWKDPVRFAISEMSRHPASPRTVYQLGQTMATLSDGTRDSAATRAAFAALERAHRLPDSGILPAQGLILLAARTHGPVDDAWWDEIDHRLATDPIGPQELGAMNALTRCAVSKLCDFPPSRMMAMFATAMGRGDNAEVLNVFGNYTLNVLGQPSFGEFAWRKSVALSPNNAQYRINLAKLLIALDKDDEARGQIAALRGMGIPGQYEQAARDLEARMAKRNPAAGPAAGRGD
ncbi:hypothetical protein FNZ56_11825 [Pseudoluteimonas lycopersici]|uniref:Tetratricopeptide repeat protein n=1 Tax=Pseudoluteimonas lycopersici TaxID=1324796 RepID=A0A516V7L1_9GAMM|nr:hypothetical protein [Lysobacter lycopersici]QDQ74519.1 hypothetical protein FNZ56_11825 [Lysobacter lycopersici]